MFEQRILQLIKNGEGITTEFKTCKNKLNRDVYETVCAFLNRHGGTLLLGVNEAGVIEGIEPNAVDQIKKDFVTAVNNSQKLAPPAYLSIQDVVVENKHMLFVYVPESSQVHRCNGRIYDRNEDGDLDITDYTEQVSNLYLRKRTYYTENMVFPYVRLEDLRSDLIEKSRNIVRIHTPTHPWSDMDDMQLIQSAQLYQADHETGQSGFTLACILLFGTDQLILSVVPAHRTDLILRKVNVDRYDDRDLVRTNLIDSYDRIIAFAQKHLPDPFYLEGIERISLRDIIFREVASNILIHREFTSGTPTRLIIEYGQVRTENPNRAHGFGAIHFESSSPYPKNPVIGAFFREIHRADELGSGMRNLMKYGKTYGGSDPEMIEGDVFRTIIKTPEFASSPKLGAGNKHETPHVTQQVAPHDTQQVTPEVNKLLSVIEGEEDRATLQAKLGLKDRESFRRLYLRPALDLGLIEMTIPDKPRSRMQRYRLANRSQ